MTISSVLETTLIQSISCQAAVLSKSIGWFFRALRVPVTRSFWIDPHQPRPAVFLFCNDSFGFSNPFWQGNEILTCDVIFACHLTQWPCFWAVPTSSHHLRCCSRQPHHKTFVCEAAGCIAFPADQQFCKSIFCRNNCQVRFLLLSAFFYWGLYVSPFPVGRGRILPMVSTESIANFAENLRINIR